jgi:hypothetical protein
MTSIIALIGDLITLIKRREIMLSIIGSIGKMSGQWGKRLGTFGTVLFKALNDANIEVIGLKPIGKFENEIIVLYKGKKKKIKLDGDMSAYKVVKKITKG